MPPHCDTKDGPVVQGALRALDTNNVDEALRFAPEDAEAEIRAAFAKALAARQVGPAAKEVADTFFAETVVRLHRAGEGAPFTGLKPAGLDVGPIIPVAERAIDTGSAEELTTVLSDTLHHETKRRFEHVMELKRQSDRGLSEWREYTSAMLGLQVWSHKLGLAMKAAAHEGHKEHHG
ncbi:MAG TPA: DUF6448 family protein [Acidimicrobiia bacterium]|nr:DUF6448 family protein [Acidimicrobiia bacterium]